jgi:transcriptional regulator with XRE-family HTH domain
MPATPTRRKRRLGQLLERLRLDADRSLADVAELLRISDSTVSRYETGKIRPGWPAIQAMLGYYGVGDEVRAEAAVLWEDAGERSLTAVAPTGSPPAFRAFLRAEAEADVERTLESVVVPGLLQTAAYARAINLAGQDFYSALARPERYVSARISRQIRLGGEAPMTFHAVMDEAVCRREIGGPEVMIEQLQHLIEMASQPNVTLQIVPYKAGAYGVMSGGFTIIAYADEEDPPLVYLEHAAGGSLVENEADVVRFQEQFAVAARHALSPDETVDLLALQVRALEKRS